MQLWIRERSRFQFLDRMRKAVPLDSQVSRRRAFCWCWFHQIMLFLSHTCCLKLVSSDSESETTRQQAIKIFIKLPAGIWPFLTSWKMYTTLCKFLNPQLCELKPAECNLIHVKEFGCLARDQNLASVLAWQFLSKSERRLLSVFYNVSRSFKSCKRWYFGFIQANILNIEIASSVNLRYSVDSECLRLFRVIDLITHTGPE